MSLQTPPKAGDSPLLVSWLHTVHVDVMDHLFSWLSMLAFQSSSPWQHTVVYLKDSVLDRAFLEINREIHKFVLAVLNP